MHLLDPLNTDYSKLSEIYQNVYEKKGIAFLGAGASVTNKQYLSKELIELYEARISKKFQTNDITKFVDILQMTPGQRRSDFDKFVVDQISKLVPNEGHEVFVTIPWKQVITTNYDTLIEEASENSIRQNKTHYQVHAIKNKKQFEYQSTDNEILYIKLNGCKTDLSSYPLVFSTEDFAKQNSFYRKVLSPFRQFSNEIIYLAFGYSFSDDFSEKLLDRLASQDFRQKRLMYCIDPFINEDKLNYLESKNIAVVKITFEDFFRNYQSWFENNNKNYLRNLQYFTNPDKSKIKIDVGSRLYLDSSIIQLKDDAKISDRLKKIDFYNGAEPNYQVVIDDFDVIRKTQLEKLLGLIEQSFKESSRTSIPKLILINGDFGTGKTTFTLRAIKEYLRRDGNTLAFEIARSLGIKKGYLVQLIKDSAATKFIFYCDNIETDSVFKSFNELRVDLATEQYSDISIVFISSIRENILEKFKHGNKFKITNNSEFQYKASYTDEELAELVDNLKEVGLLAFRDLTEKQDIVRKLSLNYKGDSFITLYKLIENGKHYKLLLKAYDELTPDVKNAFRITALIHRFNMNCPAAVLKNALRGFDWEEFTDKIIRGDGKNILFQEKASTMTNNPDLYFRTKHPVIAEALVKNLFTNTEKNATYKSIFAGLTLSDYNSWFIVDLIKNIRHHDSDITSGQIDNYYDLCKSEFESSPHFVISYITNIEKKTTSVKSLTQCLRDIEILEGTLEYRNHRLIHRKGSLNFKIARSLHKEKAGINDIFEYLEIAEDWFRIKKQMDPSSSYSYLDYLKLLIWKLKSFNLTDTQRLDLNLTINSVFDEANRVLYEDTNVVSDLYEEYNYLTNDGYVDNDYLEFLLERYQAVEFRPVAAMLLYYYYLNIGDSDKCYDFVEEIKGYSDNKDVAYFLFKHYGRNLHLPQNRMKYFEIIRRNEFLKEMSPMRYYYFTSVCEFYDYRWRDGKELLNDLRNVRQSNLNPDFFLYWNDDTGNEQVFEGEIETDRKVKKVKIIKPFFKSFFLVGGDYSKFREGQDVKVKLRFLFAGIQAEIVSG